MEIQSQYETYLYQEDEKNTNTYAIKATQISKEAHCIFGKRKSHQITVCRSSNKCKKNLTRSRQMNNFLYQILERNQYLEIFNMQPLYLTKLCVLQRSSGSEGCIMQISEVGNFECKKFEGIKDEKNVSRFHKQKHGKLHSLIEDLRIFC